MTGLAAAPTERLPSHFRAAQQDLDPMLCERACELLDRLRRSEISPYVIEGNVTNLTQNVATRMQVDDFKNSAEGPMVLLRARPFAATALAASAAGALFSNVALKLIDNDRKPPLLNAPALLPVVGALASNTCTFDRPHVIAQGGSFTAILREQNINGTTDVWLALLGEAVVGGLLSAEEVREIIGLGLYPGFLGRDVAWAQILFVHLLFGEGPRCATATGEKLRWVLRERVATLRALLSRALVTAYSLSGNVNNISTNTTTAAPSDSFRNDSGYPMMVTRVRAGTYTAVAAAAAGAVFSNVSFDFVHTGPNRKLTRTPVLAPTLFSRQDNEWVFERPLILGPDEALDIRLTEENVNATTDVFVAVHGAQLAGLSAAEARECVSLGLLQPWRRADW